jgi:hypothetical protein
MVNVGGNPRIGQRVVCNRCNTKLEIYSLDPIELDWKSSNNNIKGYNRVSTNEEDEFGYNYMEER